MTLRTAAQLYADFDVDGTTVYKPIKSQIREWGAYLESGKGNAYSSVAAATAATIPTTVKALTAAAYADSSDGSGAANYKWVASEPAHPGKFQSADGAWWEYNDNHVNICAFGATIAAADNSTALSNAFTTAAVQNKAVYVPGALGTYSYATSIEYNTLVPVFGDGMELSVLEYTGASVGMVIDPKSVGDTITYFTGHYLRDFTLKPSISLAGTYGIEVRLRAVDGDGGHHYGQFSWNRIRVGMFGTRSVYFNNTVANTDGIYLGNIRDCQFPQGIDAVNIGDSVYFITNKIHGTGTNQFSQIGGARRLVFYGNNITSNGGVAFDAAYGVDFIGNQLLVEGSYDYSGSNTAILYFGGASTEINIEENFIGKVGAGTNAAHTILIDDTSSDVVIAKNRLATGTSTHVTAAAGTSGVIVDKNNTFDVSAVVTLSGSTSESSATSGGTGQFVKQATAGGPYTTAQVAVGELDTIAPYTIVANPTGSVGNPAATDVPVVSSVGLRGSVSGQVTQQATAAAGTPTITWGTGSGTPAVTATAPLAISAAGALSASFDSASGDFASKGYVDGVSAAILDGCTFTGIPNVSGDGTVSAYKLTNTTSGAVYTLYNGDSGTNGFNGFGIYDGTDYGFQVLTGGSTRFGHAGAMATNATDGFMYMPTCAGTPTGTPTSITGKVPFVYDTTNHKFYIYAGGAWKGGTTPGAFV